jgi:hypothetical protein
LWEKCDHWSERELSSFDLILRGIARERLGISGGFSVTRDVFGVPEITGVQSLRARLRELT